MCLIPSPGPSQGSFVVGADRLQALAIAHRFGWGIAQVGGGFVAYGISQPQLQRINAQPCRQLVQGAFQGKGGLGRPKAAHLPRLGSIGVDCLGAGIHRLPVIGPATSHQRIVGDEESVSIVGARIRHNAKGKAGQLAVGSGPDPVFHVVWVPLRRGVEGLAPAVGQAHRSPDVVGSQRPGHQGPRVLLAAERASDGWCDDPHPFWW